ncbi:MAG: hypothetical protein SOR59_03075 [Lachnospiraceae bacterium]|nr:hypothetical protein [Lachnospiraceae bacterium]MDY2956579.1 hypothetical protein [Lachnospiraceae bacterium]
MNKLFLTGIATTMGAAGMVLSGCGAAAPASKEALIEDGLKKIAESSSLSATIGQNSKINVVVADKNIDLNLKNNIDIEQMLPDGSSHIKGDTELSVSGFKENSALEMYMVEEGDNVNVYTGTKTLSGDNFTWNVYSKKKGDTTAEFDPGKITEIINGIKNVNDKLELKEGTEQYNGSECYVISGSYTLTDLTKGNEEINKAFADGLGVLNGKNISSDILNNVKFNSDIYFDKKTHEIKGIKFDLGDSMTEVINSLIGSVSDKAAGKKTSISMDNAVVEFKINGYNNVKEITVPDEVKNNAEKVVNNT